MWVSRYLLWFLFFSICGWLWETLLHIYNEGNWENRGFLYGPLCPIYGVGAVSIVVLFKCVVNGTGKTFSVWQVFLISMIGSAILEYVTSWVLEKLFHAIWWDYSKMPLNLHGRICLPASLLFGAVGTLIIEKVMPFMDFVNGNVKDGIVEVLALLLLSVLSVDATLTISALTDFAKEVMEMDEKINRHMEEFVESMQEKKVAAENLIAEGKEKILEEKEKLIEEKDRILAEKDRLLAERERFSVESIGTVMSGMNGMGRRAVRRVQSYRLPGSEKTKDQMEHFMKGIRNYRKISEQNAKDAGNKSTK